MIGKFFILLLILSLVLADPPKIDDGVSIAVGQSRVGKTNQGDDFKSFQFINVKSINDKYLFILVDLNSAEYMWQKIKVSVYKYGGDNKPLVTCQSQGILDECMVPQGRLTENSTLIVAIQSQADCEYTLQSYWSNIEILKPWDQIRFMFGQTGKAQIYQLNLQGKTFEQVRITLIPETKKMPTDSVRIYGKFNFDQQPTQQQYDFKSIDLWKNGQGIFLQKHQMKSRKLSLLVVGQSQTIYVLKCQILQQNHHDINLNQTIYQHLLSKSVRIYHIKFPNTTDKDFIISFAKFYGNIQIDTYIDKDLKQKYQNKPFQYMKDCKFIIPTQQQKRIKQIYFKVQSGDRQAVFMASFDGRSKLQGIQLDQNINQFITVQNKDIVYLHFQKWESHDNMPQQLTVNILRIYGSVQAEFRVCSKQVENCISMNQYEKSSQIISTYDSTVIGLKSVYKFKIDDSYLQYMNPVQKSGYIIIVLKNLNQRKENDPSVAIIQYLHTTQVQLIRQNRPVQDIIRIGESKYYKYNNPDPQVTAVKIHLIEVSGEVTIQGDRFDPRLNQQNQQTRLIGNPLVFEKDLASPIYIKVTGLSQSTFGLTIQVIHKNDKMKSSISLSQQVQFTLQLKPGAYQKLTLHPIYNAIDFNYKSTGTVLVCRLNQYDQCTQQLPDIKSQGTLRATDIKSLQQIIIIKNPSQQRTVSVDVIYHSAKYNHCQLVKLGKLGHSIVKNKECFGFSLEPKGGDLQIYVKRIDFGQMNTYVHVCDKPINVKQHDQRFTLGKKILEDACFNRNATDWTLILTFECKTLQQNLKIQYLVDYTNNVIRLPDGVAHRIQAYTTQGAIKYFYYQLLNHVNTRVLLRNYQGKTTFYTKLVSSDQKYDSAISKIDYHYKPNSPAYFLNPTLLIKPQQIDKYCQKCGLLIAVYPTGNIGQKVDFSIQVIQNARMLNDHQMKSQMILKDSMAYYQYDSNKKGSLVVEVSDNNVNCLRIYLSKTDFPQEYNHIAKEQGNRMIYQADEGKYYIGLQATQNCMYSITVFNTNYDFVKIERGKPANIILRAGQVKYFLFRHIAKLGFKLVTLHVYGNVNIYLNQSDSTHLKNFKQNKAIQYNKFAFQDKIRNSLTVSSQDPNFCSDCYYLAAIQAQSDTQSSLLLVDKQTPITMPMNKILYDQIKGSNSQSYVMIPSMIAGSLDLTVFVGSLEVVAAGINLRGAPKIFDRLKQVQKYQFEVKEDNNQPKGFSWDPINIRIKCLKQTCAYTLKIEDKSPLSSTMNDIQLMPGQPSFLFLGLNGISCIKGFMNKKQDKIFISTTRNQISNFEKLQFDAKVGDNKMKINKFIVRNVMTLSFDLQNYIFDGTKPYQLCLKSKDNVTLGGMIQQSSQVNLLPQDVQITIKNQDTFIIYPQGPFIIDVFQCTGNSMVYHGYNEKDLQSNVSMQSLTSIGMPQQPHAIKIDTFAPTFLKIKSPLSLIRWIAMDVQSQRGLGYLKYGAGKLKYESKEDKIDIIWQTLKRLTNQSTNTKVHSVIYKIFISNNQDHLKSACQCERFLEKDVIMIQGIVDGKQQTNSVVFNSIKKTQILQKFKGTQNLYVNVVADLQLEVPKKQNQPDMEYYRFLYHSQQIPYDVFVKGQQVKLNYVLLIVLISVSLLALIVCTYILKTKVIPMISRMRSNMMVEQPDQKEGQQVIPPSSDRARISARKVADDLPIDDKA